MILDIARGLRYLQRQEPPIIHRDLRSPNVFVMSLSEDEPINCKLGDFGLSQHSHPALQEVLGTWQWLAPEVFDPRARRYDERSDIYCSLSFPFLSFLIFFHLAFAVVMWEICSRKFPFIEFKEFVRERTEVLLYHHFFSLILIFLDAYSRTVSR